MNQINIKKILLVIDQISNPHAGTEGQFLLLIEQLLQQGYQLRVLLLSDSQWLREQGLSCPFEVLGSSAIKAPATWFKAWLFARRCRAQGFTLAHIFFNDASVVCPPMFWLAGIKTIISRRDMGFWYTGIYRLLLPITGKFVSAVVSNSHAVAEVTAQVEKIPSARMEVIYNGYKRRVASDNHPATEHKNGIALLDLLNIQGAVMFGLVANIRPIKRMQDAIAALALLVADTSLAACNPHLVIVGAGDASELMHFAHTQGVAERVHCLGGRSDIPNCLRYFAAGLLCSESEGFSNAIVEYQFAGLPVICSHTGGNPEAVTQGQTGWLYPVGDLAQLSRAMQAVLQDRAAAQQMGAQAKQLAQARYSEEAMGEHYHQLYARLAAS